MQQALDHRAAMYTSAELWGSNSTTKEREGSTGTSTRYSPTTSQFSSYHRSQLVCVTETEPGNIQSGGGISSDTYGLVPSTTTSVSDEPRSAQARRRQNSHNPSLPLYSRSFLCLRRLCNLRRSYVYRRFPCSRNIWLVYVMFFLQGLAEFSALLFLFFGLDAYRINPPETVALYLFVRCLVFLASPVMGFLADTFFGRYYVMKASLYVCLAGALILAVGFSTATLDPWLKHDEVNHYETFDFYEEERWSTGTIVFIGIMYTVMLIGFTGVQVNLIPFGVDQLTDASSGELSSYFHWYYWWLTAGYLVSAATVPYIYQYYSLGPVFLLLAVCFTAEIMILILHRDNGFVILPHVGNPLKLVYQVVKSALKAKKPVFRSAFDVGRPPPSRIELAMQMNGGPFTVEQVEDVKTFFRVLLILLSFFGYFAVSSQLLTTYVLEGIRMTLPHGTYKDCTEFLLSTTHFFDNSTHSIECQLWTVLPSVWIALANFVTILILIVLVDRLLYVSCRPKMLKRMAIGKIFLLVSILVAIAVESVRITRLWKHFETQTSTIVINAIPFHTESATTFHTASPLSILWIIPQYTLFAFAEVFGSITAVEFIYAQSPGAMKGLLLGMLYLTNGIAMGCAALLIYLQSFAEHFNFLSFFGNANNYVRDILNCVYKKKHVERCVDSPLFSYILLAVAVALSVAVFMRAAIKYTFRKRDIDPYNPIV